MNNSQIAKATSEKNKRPKTGELKDIISETEIAEIAHEEKRKYRREFFIREAISARQRSKKIVALKKLRLHLYAAFAICVIGVGVNIFRQDTADVSVSDARQITEKFSELVVESIAKSEPKTVKAITFPSGPSIDRIAHVEPPRKHGMKNEAYVLCESKRLDPDMLGDLENRVTDEMALRQVDELLAHLPEPLPATNIRPKLPNSQTTVCELNAQPLASSKNDGPGPSEIAVKEDKGDKLRVTKTPSRQETPELTRNKLLPLPGQLLLSRTSRSPVPFSSVEVRMVPKDTTVASREASFPSQMRVETVIAQKDETLEDILRRYEVPPARIDAVVLAFKGGSTQIQKGSEVKITFADFEGFGKSLMLARVSVSYRGIRRILIGATDKGTFVQIPP